MDLPVDQLTGNVTPTLAPFHLLFLLPFCVLIETTLKSGTPCCPVCFFRSLRISVQCYFRLDTFSTPIGLELVLFEHTSGESELPSSYICEQEEERSPKKVVFNITTKYIII